MLPEGAGKCPDCGAATDGSAPGSADAEIYPELARANLHRMRGEYRKAEDVCNAILRRFPNNATAAALLGDIFLEEGQIEGAIRWYELAIDLDPDAPEERAKLEAAKLRLKERHALSAADQLGIPDRKPNAALYAAVALLLVVAVGVAAFLMGRANRNEPTARKGSTVLMPFEVGGSGSGDTSAAGNGQPIAKDQPTQEPLRNDLLASLKGRTSETARLVDAWQDPRTSTVYVALRFEEGDNARLIAAHLARTVFEAVATAPRIKIRGISATGDPYFADAERNAALQADPKMADEDPVGFANAILTNEHPSVVVPGDSASSGANGASGPPGDGTTSGQ